VKCLGVVVMVSVWWIILSVVKRLVFFFSISVFAVLFFERIY